MAHPSIILWIAAIAVGFFSAGKNPTALALVLAFATSKLGLPHAFYAYPDAFTIFVIWMKCILPRDVACSAADRFILLSFPLSWAVYIMEGNIAHFYWWWSLAFISIAQFLAAGWEPYSKPFRRYAEAAEPRPEYPGPFLIAYPAGGRFGGW